MNINTALFRPKRDKLRIAKDANRPGPSAWEGLPREGFTAHQAKRLAALNPPEARLVRGMVIDAAPVRGRFR